jgi:hypothetical protein
MLTKTQIRIMEVFTANITERYSIKQVSDTLKKPYPLVHRSIKSLLKDGFLMKDKHGYLSLEYRKNHSSLAFIESIRRDNLLRKRSTLKLLLDDILKGLKNEFYILLVFGSTVEDKKKANDIDLLMIVDNPNRVEFMEKFLIRVTGMYPDAKFDIGVIAIESVYEMLGRREQLNVMNETLNKHIILFGAESYYRLIKHARQ